MKIAKQSVQLVDHMGSDLSVVNAARVSFHKESNWDESSLQQVAAAEWKGELKLHERDIKLINYLATHNHWSPFSHTSLSLRVKAPIFVARQLAKHQVGAAWNEVSRRYVDEEPEFFFPEEWRKRADNVKQGSSEEKFKEDGAISMIYDQVEDLSTTYDFLLRRGICPEQARMVLPQNTMTEWIWTGSLYFFARVCNLRLDPHTQKETREVAELIYQEMLKLFPVSTKALVKEEYVR